MDISKILKYKEYIILFIIIVFAFGLRVYKLDSVAPGISWDEASVGYNAYTIWNWGKDEWGRRLPLTFKSFEDYKNPIHIYATTPFVGLLGLNEFAVRFPSAVFGTINVLCLYILALALFKNRKLSLIASFVLAISPFNIQFSRFNHELNFAIFFFLAGTASFLYGIKKSKNLIILAFLFWGIDLLTYQSAKIISPVLVTTLIFLSFKTLLIRKKQFIVGAVIYVFFVSLLFISPELLGGARLKQNSINNEEIENTFLYNKTGNYTFGLINVVGERYIKYFDKQFLFVSGDPIPRHSAQIVGTFYKMEAIFLVVGFINLFYLIIAKRSKEGLLVLTWILLAPIPAAASSSFTHAARAMFMTGSLHLVIALGIITILNFLKKPIVKNFAAAVILIAYILSLAKYQIYYYGEFATRYGTEWQYGMRDIVQTVKKHSNIYRVYMTDAFSQPYIFFLFYLKTPLPEFLQTVKYNQGHYRPSNLVVSFGKYRFGEWDQLYSTPDPSVMYIINPSKYDGLYYKNSFSIINKIEYPNGTDAFFVIN